jgi:hypothetical protein
MSVVITPVPSTGITATLDAVRFDLTGIPAVTAAGAEIAYRIEASLAGRAEKLVSHVFAPASGGTHQWMNVIFPESGSWSVKLLKDSDDSVIQTQAVTVD